MMQTESVMAIDAALLQRARVLCRQSKRSLVEELQQLSGIEARAVVRELARPFGLEVLETADMLAFSPAFDLLPLSQALARHSVLLRAADGQLAGVIADPFDLDLQTWLSARAGQGALNVRLALQADIAAYLSKQKNRRAPSTACCPAPPVMPGAMARRRPCCRSPACRKRPAPPSSWSTRLYMTR